MPLVHSVTVILPIDVTFENLESRKLVLVHPCTYFSFVKNWLRLRMYNAVTLLLFHLNNH